MISEVTHSLDARLFKVSKTSLID